MSHDNPRCPACNHYNAMLPIPGSYPNFIYRCRDCGHEASGDDLGLRCPYCDNPKAADEASCRWESCEKAAEAAEDSNH